MICRNFLLIFLAFVSFMLSACRSISTATADAQFDKGEYYDAQRNYRTIYNKLTKKNQRELRGEIAGRLALCYIKLNQPARASLMLRNAIRYGQNDSETMLMLGRSLQKEGKYTEAIKVYEEYIAAYGSDDKSDIGIAGCRLALSKENESRYKVRQAKTLNMHRSDYSPAFAGNDFDRIYFTSTNEYSTGSSRSEITGQKNGDIWLSDRNERGDWARPEPAEGSINSDNDEGTASFSPDGQTMYITRARREADMSTGLEIWISKRVDARWNEPEKFDIEEKSDTIYNYAHPAVSPDGKWLYFASDRPGGSGGYDIWRINLEHGGPPVCLGDKINTSGDELFPYVRNDSTFYFSSDGRPGLGGLDIFKASKTSSNTWVVENIPAPINSEADDFGIVFGIGESGFFSSNRGDTRGYDHIYEFELPKLNIDITGYVMDLDEYVVPDATIRIVGDDGSDRRTIVRDDGSFNFTLNLGVKYAMLASANGYLNARQEFMTESVEEDALYEVNFILAPVNRPLVIDNIFYDFDKASLRPESCLALDSLASVMKQNPSITVELSAHTDRIGSEKYNSALSERRAKSVIDYLIDHAGIDSRRLSAKGYGKDRPKTVTPRIARLYPQFQEGTVLSPEFIESLDNEQDRDAADQINRRTEFEITSVDFY